MHAHIECTAPRVTPNVHHGLWVIMMCQCRFVDYDKCIVQVGNVDGGEAVSVGSGKCILSSNFSVNLKLL